MCLSSTVHFVDIPIFVLVTRVKGRPATGDGVQVSSLLKIQADRIFEIDCFPGEKAEKQMQIIDAFMQILQHSRPKVPKH